jgi:predicted GNAT family N-acyltransferase
MLCAGVSHHVFIEYEGSSMTGLRLSRTQAAFDMEQQYDGTWHLCVPHPDGPIVVRPAKPDEPLLGAYQLIYDIYVTERGAIAPSALPLDQQLTRAKWDKWDDLPTTQHYIAIHNGQVVGHMRLVDDCPLGLPLESNGFTLHRERQQEQWLREISKLTIAKPYRGGGIMAAFYWHVFQTCRVQLGLPAIYLSCERPLAKLYRRIGGVEIGGFVHRELDLAFAAMRVDFVDSYDEQFNGGCLGTRSRRQEVPEVAFERTSVLVETAA